MQDEGMVVALVLTGARAGKTCILAKRRFVNGKLVLRGDPKDYAGTIKYFGRTYKAFPEHSKQLEEAVKAYGECNTPAETEHGQRDAVPSNVSPGRAGTSEIPANVSGGHDDAKTDDGTKHSARGGPSDTGNGNDGAQESARLQAALDSLDHKNDEHWTSAGLPQLQAVEASVGKPVSRKTVAAARPDFVRQA